MLDFFFTKRKPVAAAGQSTFFGAIGTDIHSHLIPGIDDGSPDLLTSISMIKQMHAMGFDRIITTPHVSEVYKNDHDSIAYGLARVKQLVKFEGLKVEVLAAAEYMINDLFEQAILEGGALLALPGRHVLVEMPHVSEPINVRRVLTLLNERGYVPILAHPERYRFYNRIYFLESIKDCGCLFQVNALSLLGYYGGSVSDVAWKLLDRKLIDFVGTDFHHENHIELFKKKMTPACADALGTYPFKNRELGLPR